MKRFGQMGFQALSKTQLKNIVGGLVAPPSCEGGCTEDKDCGKGEYCDLNNPCSTSSKQKNPQCKTKSL